MHRHHIAFSDQPLRTYLSVREQATPREVAIEDGPSGNGLQEAALMEQSIGRQQILKLAPVPADDGFQGASCDLFVVIGGYGPVPCRSGIRARVSLELW